MSEGRAKRKCCHFFHSIVVFFLTLTPHETIHFLNCNKCCRPRCKPSKRENRHMATKKAAKKAPAKKAAKKTAKKK